MRFIAHQTSLLVLCAQGSRLSLALSLPGSFATQLMGRGREHRSRMRQHGHDGGLARDGERGGKGLQRLLFV